MTDMHTIRTKDGGTVSVRISRSRAIKIHCTECGGWGEMHPKDCPDKLCALYPFRGKIHLAYGATGGEAASESQDEDVDD